VGSGGEYYPNGSIDLCSQCSVQDIVRNNPMVDWGIIVLYNSVTPRELS